MTAEKVSACKMVGMEETDQSAPNYVSYCWSHIDILPHNEVRGMDCDLVLLARPFPPRLLPNNPHTSSRSRRHLRRLLGHNILKSRHCLQPAFESFTGSNNGKHVLIVLCLVEQNRIVGGLVEEWRSGEVEQHCGELVKDAREHKDIPELE